MVDLRLQTEQIKTGQSFVYRQTVETETEFKNTNGEVPRMKSVAQSDFLCQLENQTPEGSQWRMRLTRQTWSRYWDDKLVQSYDSEDRESQLQYLLEYLLISDSMQFTYYLDTRGRVQRMEGLTEFMAKIDAKLPSPQERQAFKHLMSDMGTESFLEMGRNVWVFYPNKPLRQNTPWTTEKNIAMLNAQVQDNYKIKLSLDNAYDLELTTTVKTDPAHPGELKIGASKLFFQLDGGGSGHLRVRKTLGMLEQYYHNQLLIGTVTFQSPFSTTQNLPASIKTTTWIELLNP